MKGRLIWLKKVFRKAFPVGVRLLMKVSTNKEKSILSFFQVKGKMRYITDFARSIDKKAQLMDNASEMAHQGIIDFEIAQKIIDVQKRNLTKDIEYLLAYLKDEDEEN